MHKENMLQIYNKYEITYKIVRENKSNGTQRKKNAQRNTRVYIYTRI